MEAIWQDFSGISSSFWSEIVGIERNDGMVRSLTWRNVEGVKACYIRCALDVLCHLSSNFPYWLDMTCCSFSGESTFVT